MSGTSQEMEDYKNLKFIFKENWQYLWQLGHLFLNWVLQYQF